MPCGVINPIREWLCPICYSRYSHKVHRVSLKCKVLSLVAKKARILPPPRSKFISWWMLVIRSKESLPLNGFNRFILYKIALCDQGQAGCMVKLKVNYCCLPDVPGFSSIRTELLPSEISYSLQRHRSKYSSLQCHPSAQSKNASCGQRSDWHRAELTEKIQETPWGSKNHGKHRII